MNALGKGILAIISVCTLLASGYWFYDHFWYSSKRVELFEKNRMSMVMKGKILPYTAKKNGDTILLPVSFLKERIDPYLYVDSSTNSILITTKNNIIQLKEKDIKGWVEPVTYTLPVPLQQEGNAYWIPVDPLLHVYPLQVDSENKRVIVVTDPTDTHQMARIESEKKRGQHLRLESNRQSSITADVSLGEKVEVIEEQPNWVLVQKKNGYFGWIQKEMLGEINALSSKPTGTSFLTPTTSTKGKINVAWEAVYCCNPDPSTLSLPGVNVVSPTWLALGDANGTITDKTSLPYINWAKANGKQLWTLFSNDFKPDQTHAFLTNFQARMNAIQQLVTWSKAYGFEGINIDFENVYVEDKPHLVEFVRELTPFLHKEGKVVSIDVTHPGGGEMWSLFLDRQALAETVDYVMLMSYDEHWANSPEAGSVASLPWVEKGIQETLKEVPAEKLILGVPLYTRLWTIKDGKVTSQTMSMDAAKTWVAERGLIPVEDEQTKQQYVESLNPDGSLSKMWLENESSITHRIQLIHKYKLAGMGSWARSFSSPDIWNVMNQHLHGEGSP